MFCRHCGAELAEGARFCSNCCAPVDYDYHTGEMGGGTYTPIQPSYNIMPKYNEMKKQAKPKKKHRIRNFLIGFMALTVFCNIWVDVPKGSSIICGGKLKEGAWDYNDKNFIYTERNQYEKEIPLGQGEVIKGYLLPSGEYRLETVEAPLDFCIYQFVSPTDKRYHTWPAAEGLTYNFGENAKNMRMYLEVIGNERNFSEIAPAEIGNGVYPKYKFAMGDNGYYGGYVTLEQYNLVVVTKGKIEFVPY